MLEPCGRSRDSARMSTCPASYRKASVAFRRYKFIYIPDDESPSREVGFPRVLLFAAAGCVGLLTLVSAMYVAGVFQGSSWLPGGSRLQRENARLSSELLTLEDKIEVLRDDLSESYRLQSTLARAVGLSPMDPDVRKAGIGGRGPETAGLRLAAPSEASRASGFMEDIDTLLRQTRIQQKGYRAILDTLSARAAALARIPSIRPVDIGWQSSGFGRRTDPFTGKSTFHTGLDFAVPVGTLVRATADGTVVALKNERGMGKMIRIDHGDRLTTAYAHLSAWKVRSGQKVKRGDVIAVSGNTGRSTAPHLHYEVAVDGRKTDPRSFILDSYAIR